MLATSPIQSPLAEKRLTFSAIAKQMIGRRAYTDSICKKMRPISLFQTVQHPITVSSNR